MSTPSTVSTSLPARQHAIAATDTADTSLRDLLRSATASAHGRLEDALDLLRPPLQRQRFLRVLAGFHGFHAAWEPAIAARLQAPAFTAPRQRLDCTKQDLLALGLQPADVRALPACAAAASLCNSLDGALGALYVVEGSTLGGKLIARQLAQTPWCPAGGLRYFDAHGADSGRLWRETLAFISSQAHDPQQVVLGAQRAFDVLRGWLVSAIERPAADSGVALEAIA